MASGIYVSGPVGFVEPNAYYNNNTPGTIVAAGSNVRGIAICFGSVMFSVSVGGYIRRTGGSFPISYMRLPPALALTWDKAMIAAQQDDGGNNVSARLLIGGNPIFEAVGAHDRNDSATYSYWAGYGWAHMNLAYRIL
jgi:hypothetical protein